MNATEATATSTAKTAGLPAGRTTRAGFVICLMLAVVVGLLHLQQAPASANDGEICTLKADGSLSCPSDPAEPAPSFPPPDLLNPRILAEAPPAQAESLRRLQAEAVDLVRDMHALPESDRDAVKSWGRTEALSKLWTLLVQAIKTSPEERTADQQNAVDWLADLAHRQTEDAARQAGAEYARFAGLDVHQYWSKAGGSEEELRAFLSKPPVGYDRATVAESTGGYCKYRSPAPYQEEYTGHTVQPCYTPCTGVFCQTPTPTFDQFVKWGQAVVSRDMQAGGFGLSIAQISAITAISAAVAGAYIAMGSMGVVIGATVSASFGLIIPGVAAGAFVATQLAVAAVAVAVVIIALASLIVTSMNFADQDALPGKLAALVVRARTQVTDPARLLSTTDGQVALLSQFVRAVSPRPRTNENCDNSLIPLGHYGEPGLSGVTVYDPATGRPVIVNTTPCLNPPPVPPAASTDPQFEIFARDAGVVSRSRIIRLGYPDGDDATTDPSATVRTNGHWFVIQTPDGKESQALGLPYTNWEGRHMYAALLQEGTHYRFATVSEEALTSGASLESCQADATCKRTDRIEYVGPDGNRYQATLMP